MNQQQYIRTKHELDKNAFKSALKEGGINWEGFDYEIEEGLSVTLSDKLGELLILFPE